MQFITELLLNNGVFLHMHVNRIIIAASGCVKFTINVRRQQYRTKIPHFVKKTVHLVSRNQYYLHSC